MYVDNTPFGQYRTTVAGLPITQDERMYVVQPLLQDDIVKKMIGLKMMTDGTMDNDMLGYLLASGRM